MPAANITGTIIANGYNCVVRIGTSAADAKPVALASSFQVTEDFQVQEAVVLGHLGPVSLDPQGYTCSVTIDGFLPAKGFAEGTNVLLYGDQGADTLQSHIPTRDGFMAGAGLQKIAYMDFYNKHTNDNKVLIGLEGVIVTSSGISAEGNSYVRNNVQLRALTAVR
jgi:hypothetical protein